MAAPGGRRRGWGWISWGEIPLLLDIRESGDAGTPIVASAPQSVAGQAYTALAAAGVGQACDARRNRAADRHGLR